jgi:peptidoglycan/LPS O-acetylase OafA/YrhL
MSFQYFKALDGVRGIAILLVILFHYGLLGCGWIGVQLFFVLSGYLITSILLKERKTSLSNYLKRFYWRRSLRIFPLYYLYLLVILGAYLSLKIPPAFADQWPYLFTYTYNVRHILPNYDGSPLLIHLWSLSVEEQFYLIWPALVFVFAARRFKPLLLGIVVVVPLLRLLTSLYLTHLGSTPVYLGTVLYTITPFQIDAFATGALVSAVLSICHGCGPGSGRRSGKSSHFAGHGLGSRQ